MSARINRNTSLLRIMACVENQNFATRRLLKDFKEMQSCQDTTFNVSCAPLDDDLFVWHGNLSAPEGSNWEGSLYHFELRFPQNYPIQPPSLKLFSEIDHPCVMSQSICLDLFNPPQKDGRGWSPAYTVQSILLQLQSFLFESLPVAESDKEAKHRKNREAKLIKKANEFECSGCQHRGKINPYPPTKEANPDSLIQTKSPLSLFQEGLICFHTKLTKDECPLGLGLSVERIARTGNMHYCNPLPDLISLKAFNKLGIRQGFSLEKFDYWIPLHLAKADWPKTLHLAKRSLSFIKTHNAKRLHEDQVEEIMIRVVASLLIKTADLKTHPSCNMLQSLVFMHGLALALMREYPNVRTKIESRLEQFINDPEQRVKDNTPNILHVLIYLFFTDKYTFAQVIGPYSLEQIDRQIFWLLKKIPELQNTEIKELDSSKVEVLFKSQAVSYSLVVMACQYLKHIKSRWNNWTVFLDYLETHSSKLPEDLENSIQKKLYFAVEHLQSFDEYYDLTDQPRKSLTDLVATLKTAIASSKSKKYHGDDSRDAVPSGPDQIKALPFKQQSLKQYISEKKLTEADDSEWRKRSLERWSKVNRYYQSMGLNLATPGEIASLLDTLLPKDYLIGSETQDAKTSFDKLCRIPIPTSPVLVDYYGADFTWRELYLKLSIEEDVLFINQSEDIVGLYETVEVSADHVKSLTLMITDSNNLKSKYYYLTKTLGLLKNLKSLTLVGVGLSIISTKALLAISKGLANLYKAGGTLDKLTFRNFLIGASTDSASCMLDIFQQCSNIKALEVRKSDVLAVKGGEFLSRLVSQSTTLLSLYFDDALTSDSVGQHLADGLMRNNRLQVMTVANHSNIGTSVANIVYNLAFSASLKFLEISANRIGDRATFIYNLQKFISINQSVQTVILNDLSQIPDSLTLEFFKSIASSTSLESLSISSSASNSGKSFLSGVGAQLFGFALSLNAHKGGKLRNLYVRNLFTPQSIRVFAESLYYTQNMVDQWFGSKLNSESQSNVEASRHNYMCNLKVLDIEGANISQTFDTGLWTKIKNRIVVGKNYKMDASLILFSILTQLTHLGLRNCSINEKTLEAIKFVLEHGYFEKSNTPTFSPKDTKIEFLDLAFNPLKKEGAKVLATLSPKFTHLTTLVVNHCKLGVSGANSLAKSALVTNLAVFDLFCNRIDVDGIRSLGNYLKSTTKLRAIDLGFNRIKDEGLNQLASALEASQNKSLVYLGLRFNLFGFNPFEAFLNTLKNKTSTRVLLIKRNLIDDYFLEQIKQSMKDAPSLSYIDLLDKQEFFTEERTARTIWIPGCDGDVGQVSSVLSKIDPNIRVLNVVKRTGRTYPNKQKGHVFAYAELSGPAASAKILKKLAKDKKKRTGLAVVMKKAKMAGTANYYYNKYISDKSKSITNIFRPTGTADRRSAGTPMRRGQMATRGGMTMRGGLPVVQMMPMMPMMMMARGSDRRLTYRGRDRGRDRRRSRSSSRSRSRSRDRSESEEAMPRY